MDRVVASMSPNDTAAAVRLLKVLEEGRQTSIAEAEAWSWRITGWARRPSDRSRYPVHVRMYRRDAGVTRNGGLWCRAGPHVPLANDSSAL